MKKILMMTLIFGMMFNSYGQGIKIPAPSPGQTIKQDFSLSSIEVVYSRPVMKGRKIFGDIVPFGKLWRTGANSPTKFTFGEDVKVAGQSLKAGSYQVMSIPSEKSWVIIFSKGTNGVFNYNASEDVLKVTVPSTMLANSVESFSIQFSDVSSNKLNIQMAWEKTSVSIPVETDVDSKIMGSIDRAMNIDSKPYFEAASYYFETGRDIKKALNTLHECFFEDNAKQLNLFVMGVGNVGEKFIEQIHQQKKFLKENLKINLRVIALSNSRKMLFDEEGMSLNNWKTSLENGEVANKESFISNVIALNLRNSIFVDVTANESISQTYAHYLKQNISVVTCNKIACSSAYENYNNLKQLSRKFNAPFLFETNVGAGLPIIDTLKHLIASGDKVHKIQAVLSGSLNFIFNNFDEKNSFHDVVKEAGVQGFTEPDPKIDLSGVDVARKILILIRESGYKMEIEEIANESFLPVECLETKNNKDFFASLIKNAAHFENIYKEALAKDNRLKYVAKFEDGKASVGLQFIPKESPFYNLEGKDNIVQFYTDRYVDQPLLIKGAGAGAAVTASGIFADVIRIGNV